MGVTQEDSHRNGGGVSEAAAPEASGAALPTRSPAACDTRRRWSARDREA